MNTQLTAEELVQLSADDAAFYFQTFFPNTVRQGYPAFHHTIDSVLDSINYRHVALEVFRGGAKTTKLRLFTVRRVAFGLSRTILYIGKSEGHAARSIKWIMRQIERNPFHSQIFGLKPAKPWSESGVECCIHNTILNQYITILGMGITGSVRGINVDDWRPDLIIVDDPVDEENSATMEGRKKISDLFFGAILESLAPASESPLAKLALAQTPINPEDILALCKRRSDFKCLSFPKLTNGDYDGESAWPERWTKNEILLSRAAAYDINNGAVWERENMNRLISAATADFRPDWLQFWDTLPFRMTICIAIDPVPPPSEIAVAKGFHKKDFEAISVVGRWGHKFFVLQIESNRGHDPSWTIATFFTLEAKWSPQYLAVESVAYQATLAWLLREEMNKRSTWVTVIEIPGERRSKRDRIVDTIKPIASARNLNLHKSQTNLISQYTNYPSSAHDDELDSIHLAIRTLSERPYHERDANEVTDYGAIPAPSRPRRIRNREAAP